jgi:prevent-host-death family protein
MLDLSQDICSLSDFKRNSAPLVEQLKRTGRPVVLTLNGKADLVVQDVVAYQRLLDRIRELELHRP